MRALAFAAAVLACAPLYAQPRPSEEEQSRIIEAARSASLNYAQSLPDFICNETVHRSTTSGRFLVSSDVLAIQVSYAGQTEKHKLVSINGSATEETYESIQGLVSAGEFGMMLTRIFDLESAARFQWKGWTTIAKRPAALYAYTVDRANSHHEVGYRTADGGIKASIVGYKGAVALDRETSRVLRLTLEATGIPSDFTILSSGTTVEYAFIDVAGAKHLLPVSADLQMTRPHEIVKNVIAFTAYRKFSADSTIDFK